jgi:O-antigen ligase
MSRFIVLLGGYLWLTIHRPFEVWSWVGDLRVERVYMLLTIGVWALFAKKNWVNNRLNGAFAAFTLWLLAAWVTSPYFEATNQRVEDWMKICVLYILLISSVGNERDLRLVVVFFVAVIGLYLTHSLREYFGGKFEYRMGVVRMIGVDKSHGNPNALSGTIIYALPLSFALWPEFSGRRARMLLVYFMALSILCVILTGSRAGFVELCCLCVLATLMTRQRVRVLAFLLVALPVVWLSISERHQNRFLTIWDPSYGPKNAQESAELRVEFFWTGMRLWGERPVTGFGPGSFGIASGTGYSPHNLYVQILAELGTPAGLSFLAILAGFALNHLEIRRLRRGLPPHAAAFPARLSGAIMMSLILMLIQGMSGHNLYRLNWMVYGAFQAVALRCVREAAAGAGGDVRAALPPP